MLLRFSQTTSLQKKIGKQVRISAARNEYEAFQVAIKSKTDLEKVKAWVGPLKHLGGYTITEKNMKCNFVGLVPAISIPAHSGIFPLPRPLIARVGCQGRNCS